MTIVKAPIGQYSGAEGSDDQGQLPTIYVEVESAPVASSWDQDQVRETRAEKIVVIANDLLGDAVDLARAAAARFSAGLAQLPAGVPPPKEVELQLGITLDSELGAVLAKARAGAQLQVTLKWQRPE